MQIKIVSLNLWEGGRLFDEAIVFIKQENPDILVLQEVHNGHDASFESRFRSMQVLRSKLPELAFSHFAPAFLAVFKFGKLDEGNAVFSKFPIVSASFTHGDVSYGERVWDVPNEAARVKRNLESPRNLQHVVVDVEDRLLNVFNTQGIWGLDGLDSPRRLSMAETIVNHLQGKSNIILCGDFNFELRGTKALEIIETKGRVCNVFGEKLTKTFNMRRKPVQGTYATSVVDGIFVSPSFRILSAHCPDVDISGHLPLVATVGLG